MNYVYFGILAYLVLGVVLTRSVLRAPRRRMRFWDIALGAVVIPVLSLVLFLFILCEDAWKRLLIALDFDPPEEMRAGPKDEPPVENLPPRNETAPEP